MKAGGGAQKGAEFEREQAKLLSLWVSAGKDKDLFWRTGMSGGRASQGMVKGAHIGDLGIIKSTPEAADFVSIFCVECKRYKAIDIMKGWVNEKSDLRSFWRQVLKEATNNRLRPLLIIKPDRTDTMMVFDAGAQNLVPSLSNLPSLQLKDDGLNILIIKQKDVLALPWSDFKNLKTTRSSK